MFCDQCGQPVPPGTAVCPHCGAQLGPPPPQPVVPAQRGPSPAEQLPVLWPPDGHRAQGPGTRAYLVAILLRNLRGSGVGIFAAWFNVPFVVLMAAVGAVIGAAAGAVSGTFAGAGVLSRIDAFLTWIFPLPVKAQDLLPTAAAQVGGIIGAILGGLNGGWQLAVMAFVWPWQQLYEGDPMWPVTVAVGQVVTALVVGVLYLAWSTATEAVRLRIAGARRMSRRETAWLMPIVNEAAGRLGMRRLPRILIDDRREANAHAGIRHIVLNQGLLEQLNYDREQIGAVIAHELVHWRDGDTIAAVWSRGVALPLYLLYELADRLSRAARFRPLQFVVRLLFWSVIFTVRRLVIPVQASMWRRAEYRADAIASAAGYGPGLRRALTYVRHSFDGQRAGWDAAILATHPPTELRLEALEHEGRTYALREDHPLAQALPGWSSTSTVEKDR